VKGKLTNAVGSQYPSHYLGTWCIRFAERRNLAPARVPSHFKRSQPLSCAEDKNEWTCASTPLYFHGKYKDNFVSLMFDCS